MHSDISKSDRKLLPKSKTKNLNSKAFSSYCLRLLVAKKHIFLNQNFFDFQLLETWKSTLRYLKGVPDAEPMGVPDGSVSKAKDWSDSNFIPMES